MSYFDANNGNVDDIPDRLDLGAGEYQNVEIKDIREFTNKNGKVSIIATFRDIDPDSDTSGLTFDWFISVPTQGSSNLQRDLVYFKRNLATLGVPESEMSDVDFARVDKKPSPDTEKYIGQTGSLVLVQNGQWTNIKYFRLHEAEQSFEEKEAQKKEAEKVWESKEESSEPTTSGDFDIDSFLDS